MQLAPHSENRKIVRTIALIQKQRQWLIEAESPTAFIPHSALRIQEAGCQCGWFPSAIGRICPCMSETRICP